MRPVEDEAAIAAIGGLETLVFLAGTAGLDLEMRGSVPIALSAMSPGWWPCSAYQ
ncbi:hypothetical protein Psi02_47060 [Planotetraspora silvatica]|uniref:Uncharacterized protein n=1 Tax=Planotetraspora silvatica TaxID=234614 RepID=A0A8J3UR43_9ACTN|nr:hypothetical protein Psi02_47060 [Planotetraspora silvatica]